MLDLVFVQFMGESWCSSRWRGGCRRRISRIRPPRGGGSGGAEQFVVGHGEIVAEFFDVGQSRAVAWSRRPESARLLAALEDPDRGFDAVVVGEPQRLFYDNQYGLTLPVFVHFGVPLWAPEVGGQVDPDCEAHTMIMSKYAAMSKAERRRIQVRVHAAMAAQTELEGRFLGGGARTIPHWARVG